MSTAPIEKFLGKLYARFSAKMKNCRNLDTEFIKSAAKELRQNVRYCATFVLLNVKMQPFPHFIIFSVFFQSLSFCAVLFHICA